MDVAYTFLLFLMLLASASGGWLAQSRLHERHVSAGSVEAVRLMIGMLLTFSALVLGLLTSSAKERFDGYNADLGAYSADLVELDHRLRLYGEEAAGIRVLLRSYTAAAIADTWPGEAPPAGQYPRLRHAPGARSVEGEQLGDMLAAVDVAIEALAPADDFHRRIAARLSDRAALTIQQRWQLIFSARSTISWPFLLVLTSWLAIIFAVFGLTTPRNELVYVVVTLAALSIASPLYLILDYSGPLTGLLKLSSASMRTALVHMDRPG